MADFQFNKITESILKLDKALKQSAKSSKEAQTALKEATSGKEIVAAVKKVNAIQKENLRLQKEKQKVVKKGIALEKKASKEAEKYSLTIQKRIAREKLLAKSVKDLANAEVKFAAAAKGSLESMRAGLSVLKLRHKSMQVGTKREIAYRKRILQTTNAIKKQEIAMGTHTRNVGNYGSALGGASKKMGAFVKRMGAMLLAYVGFQAVFRTIRQSVDLFKIQEQAVRDNQAVFGKYSGVLQRFAADVQKVTTVGDEQTIALTTQAANFGIAVDKVQEATIGSIGLAEKFKKAGLSQETALKGIALAYSGNFSQLERYIPALRNTKDQTEKMAILQREMAKGFDLSKEAAKSQTGELEQLKNRYGDLKEQIGKKLIPVLVSVSKFFVNLITVQSKLSEELADQRMEVNKLSVQLADSNTSLKRREEILKELEKINPNIIQGLEAENLNYEQLKENVKLYNEEIIKKIAIAKLDEEQQDKLNDAAEATVKRVKDELELQEELLKINADVALGQGTVLEKYEKIYKQLTDNVDVTKIYEKEQIKIGLQLDRLTTLGRTYKRSLEDENSELGDVTSIQERITQMKKLLGLEDKISDKYKLGGGFAAIIKEGKKGGTDPVKTVKQLNEELERTINIVGSLRGEATAGDQSIIDRLLGIGARRDDNQIGEEYKETFDRVEETARNAKGRFDKIKEILFGKEGNFLSRLFGGGENGKAIAETLTNSFNQLFQTIVDTTQQEIERLDQLINRQNDAIDKTQDLLTEENRALSEAKANGEAYDTTEKERLQDQLRRDKEQKRKLLQQEKEARQKAKKLAITQGIIDTSGAVLKALSSSAPPLNFILAAITAALGAVQVSTIRSSNFAEGTESVKGFGHPDGVDTVPAMVSKNERIFSVKQNKNIPKWVTNEMAVDAINGYYSGGQTMDLSVTNGYLAGINKNTQKNEHYNPDGSLAWETKGRTTIYYN